MLIASLKDSKIDASHNSFVRAFPNATTAPTVRTWLTSQYDVIGLKNIELMILALIMLYLLLELEVQLICFGVLLLVIFN